MLVELAMVLQTNPREPEQLNLALRLYDQALELAGPEHDTLLQARIKARRAILLHMIPSTGSDNLVSSAANLEEIIDLLENQGTAEEAAEAHLNLGLVKQTLAGFHKARITDAIIHYQKSLRVFTKDDYPVEFAILHNNLATAFLSIPVTDERASVREALAVQSFQAALEVVTLESDPVEYAMLQNNLGNALQMVSSIHSTENCLRALEAYDEALKVRNRESNPMAYANTLANKANCLCNLPDNKDKPEQGNEMRRKEALRLYEEAAEIFELLNDSAKANIITEAITDLRNGL